MAELKFTPNEKSVVELETQTDLKPVAEKRTHDGKELQRFDRLVEEEVLSLLIVLP